MPNSISNCSGTIMNTGYHTPKPIIVIYKQASLPFRVAEDLSRFFILHNNEKPT